MKTKFNVILTLLLAFMVQISFAQEKTITGTVSDDTGPLPGVSVLIKGSTTGVETDFNGKYTIKSKVGDVLVFSFVGMKTEEVTVGDSKVVNILLKSSNLLDEVVIVGYGSMSKKKLTNNVVKLTSDEMEGVPISNFQTSIAGKAAGVQVVQTNGKLESGVGFRIRGVSSISAGSDPLFVVDGIPLVNLNESNNGAPTNPLLTLGTNEIESIDILKDASSAAIYGSRANNGVVLITTKKGKLGKSQININTSVDFSSPTNIRKFLNSKQYIELILEAAKITPYGDLTGYVSGRLDRYSGGQDWENGNVTSTDWSDFIYQNAFSVRTDANISGGNEKTKYFFSLAFNDLDGIVRGNFLKRASSRLNISHKFNDKLSFGMNVGFSKANIDRIANDNSFLTPGQAIAQSPLTPAFDDDGEPTNFPTTLYANFLLEDKYATYETIMRRVTGNVFGEYQIFSNLKYRMDLGYDYSRQTEDQFRGAKTPFNSTNGVGFASSVDSDALSFANYVTFNESFDEKHDLEVTVGTEFNILDRRYQDVTGNYFPDGLNTINSAAEIVGGKQSFSGNRFFSYFGRLNYAFNDRYLLSASFRRDGSSRFGKNNRFGNFPAVSAAWVVSEEDFMSDDSFLNYLKIKAGWGTTGNANIGNFSSISRLVSSSYNKLPGVQITQAENPDLTWEKSDGFDVGFDFGISNNLVTGEFNYFSKEVNGLLFNTPIPGTSGLTTVLRNIGNLSNKGVEVTLNANIIRKEKLNWSVSTNFTKIKNEIVSLPDGEDVISGNNILRVGESLNAFYLREYAGVNPDNGDALYYLNGGTASEAPTANQPTGTTNNITEANRIIAGSPIPNFYAGLSSNLTYKNLDFSFTFQGEWGASIYNGGGRWQSSNFTDWFDNQTVDQLNRWQKPGDVTNVPQARFLAGNGNGVSTRFLDEADFIRLRNITLGYTLPKNVLDKIGVEKIRFYLAGLNLLTFTDYSGTDPEARSDTSSLNTGQDFYSVAPAKTYTFGVNFTF